MVTLAQIEQEVAPRLGPYRRDVVASAVNLTIVVTKMTSSIDLGGFADLYLLRRGETISGVTVAVVDDDRVRQVDTYESSTGTTTIDRLYATPPVAGEYVEFHHLDPAMELRPAVLAGLKRCYFADRVALSLGSASVERNITTLAPWITNESQLLGMAYQSAALGAPAAPSVAVGAAGALTGNYLYRVTFVTATGETQGGVTSAAVAPVAQRISLTSIPTGTSGLITVTARKLYRTKAGGVDGTQQLVTTINDNTTTSYTDNTADAALGAFVPFANTTPATAPPVPVFWDRPFVQAGQLWVTTSPDPYPNTFLVRHRRAHWSYVNGGYSSSGPSADADVFTVDLAYAAAAAHVEAWRLWQDRLAAAAAEGKRLPLAAAADVFTQLARQQYRPESDREVFDLPFGPGTGWWARNSLS